MRWCGKYIRHAPAVAALRNILSEIHEKICRISTNSCLQSAFDDASIKLLDYMQSVIGAACAGGEVGFAQKTTKADVSTVA